MKGLLVLASLFMTTLAFGREVSYPVKNFKYLSENDYRTEVQESSKYVLIVFSSKECLERTIIEPSCFMFEKKLDAYTPSFSSQVKVVAFNTYFDNYLLTRDFDAFKAPMAILIQNNQILERFEPTYAQPDLNMGRLGWQDELLRDVLKSVSQIR